MSQVHYTRKLVSNDTVELYQFWQGPTGSSDRKLSWATAASSLESDAAFQDLLSRVLSESRFEAFLWECAPLSPARAAEFPFEFAVVRCDSLLRAKEDSRTFGAYLDDAKRVGKKVVRFENLGGDARLVVPSKEPEVEYAHMGRFIRSAEVGQAREVWIAVGDEVNGLVRKGDTGSYWVSTCGLGVYYVHVRIDTTPKYYTYAPYIRFAA